MSQEIPEIEGCCEKEFYAFFGLAVYWAQVIEHSAINLAMVLKLPSVNLVSQELFDELYNSSTKKTFGQLLKSSKSIIELSIDDETYLNETLELRNILMHHYIRGHSENLISEVGRVEIMEELKGIISKFKRADKILESIYAPLWEQYGVTEQFIESELERLKLQAELRDKI